MTLREVGIGHPAVRDVLAINRNTAPNRYRLAVAEGLWAAALLRTHALRVDRAYLCPELLRSADARAHADWLAATARRSYRVSARTLARISERDAPDGLLALVEMPAWDPADLAFGPSALVLVADGLEIPGNLGTLIRTLDACGADALVLTNRRTRMSHPKVLRGSRGTSLLLPSVEFARPEEASAWLRARGFAVYLADTDGGTHYRRLDYRGRVAFVVGNERHGISRPWYGPGSRRVGVPMLGAADSLNVSVSASVLLYEARARLARW